jgi:trimethylamine:corrinoid methyltransferase-like protein
MSTAHTRRNYRQHWYPEILSRDTYDTWKGKEVTIEETCRRKANDILVNHQPSPLSAETEAELERILRRYILDFNLAS